MNERKERIRRLVSLYFEGVPFSAQTMEAQRAIQAALEGELDRLPPELGQETAFETVVQRLSLIHI